VLHKFELLKTRLLPAQSSPHNSSSAVGPELQKFLSFFNVILELGASVDVFLKEFVNFIFAFRVVSPDPRRLVVQCLKYFVKTAVSMRIFMAVFGLADGHF